MNLKQQIEADLTKSLKEKEQVAVSSLRFLLNAVHNEEIAQKKRGKLTDEDIQKVIFSLVKKHRDSIEAFRKGNREDLVEKEKAEMKVLEKYLPRQLNEEEIKKIVQNIIDKNKDQPLVFGRIMGLAMKEVKGKAGGQVVNRIVKQSLEKPEEKN